jgi:hypothetical protein
MEQYHTIGKLLLELELPSSAAAMPLQEKMSNVCKDGLLAALSTLLDSWAGPDTLLCIDRLEIDLGECSPQALERELPEKLVASLRERYPSIQQQTQLETGMERRPLVLGYFESWLHFLKHGLLPPTTHVHDIAAWEAGVLETLATSNPAMEKSRRLLETQPAALSRLLLQFSPQFIQHWIQAYAGPAQQPLIQMARAWEQYCYSPAFLLAAHATAGDATPSLPDRTVFRRQLDEWSIRRILQPSAMPEAPALLEELIIISFGNRQLPLYIDVLQRMHPIPGESGMLLTAALGSLRNKYAPVNEDSITANVRKAAGPDGATASHRQTSEASEQDASRAIKENDRADEGQAPASKKPDITATDVRNNRLPSRSAQAEDGTSAARHAEEQPAEDGLPSGRRKQHSPEEASLIKQPVRPATTDQGRKPGMPPEGLSAYVNNAGLVLLHPYLHILFDALGLLEKRAFKTPAEQDKAVQLLGYLASGDTDTPEYELVFPKLLCGLLPEDPVDRFIGLTEQDKTEANELLGAVINNWSALGNTSADGLRGNFLMRDGRLKWQEAEWRLRVTQAPCDLLLNRLPWGLSVVRLPWMPWVLKTEWV